VKARENPFRSECVLRIRYRPEGWTWPELLDRLAALRWRAALVGPHGSGKTTLLEDLEPHLRRRGFEPVRLRRDDREPRFTRAQLRALSAALTARHVVLLDGAELLGGLAWRKFVWRTRRAGGLVVTLHRPGRLPTLVECRSSATRLREIVRELTGEVESFPVEAAAELLARHAGNLREALRELYDRRGAQAPGAGVEAAAGAAPSAGLRGTYLSTV
jgi:nucleoside-triphosphatase THEP1